MRRTNERADRRPDALYDDRRPGRDRCATAACRRVRGGLAEAERAIRPNEVYNTNLRLIFYDEPTFGHYQQHFEQNLQRPPLYQPACEHEPF